MGGRFRIAFVTQSALNLRNVRKAPGARELERAFDERLGRLGRFETMSHA